MIWQPLNLSEVCQAIPSASQLTACSALAYAFLNVLVDSHGDSRDRIEQEKVRHYHAQCDDRAEQLTETEEYDFIVVGAGAAGCIIANRLSEYPQWKVLLLEAGPEQPDVTLMPGVANTLLGSNIDWKYTTEPNGKSCLARPGQRCDWPRGKMLGGSSSINSMTYVRGNKLDYDGWAELGNDGWSYEEVLPYFKKSEKNLNIENKNRKYHGVDGEQTVSRYPFIDKPSFMLLDAFVEEGMPLLDFNAEDQLGALEAQAFAQGGVRVSTNHAFIQKKRNKINNLTVRLNSEAFKILIDDNNVAYGVKYIRDGKVHEATATKEVIVSGGAINSPKLLMLSGIGPKKHLKELNIPLVKNLAVGENLHDHVTFNGIVIALPNKTATWKPFEEIIEDIKEYDRAEFKNGPLSAFGPINVVMFIKTEEDLPAPDIQYQFDSCIWREFVNNPVDYERVPIIPKPYYDAIIPRTMNLVPKSRGKLLLNASDPHGSPLLDTNYFGDPSDLIPLIKGVKVILKLKDTKAFKDNGAYFVEQELEACTDFSWGTDEYIECLARSYTSTTYHPVGTCKMGPKRDRKAVVDSRLRVYGIKGLRVIDASIMPFVIRGNTNAPSMMIGERGVAFVIEEWLKRSSCVAPW